MPDDQYTLTYPGTEFAFGPVGSPVVHMAAPDFGPVDLRTDDTDRPRADGRAFGTDYRSARTITFDLAVIGANEAAVRAQLAPFAKAWRGDAVRMAPGTVAELHYTQAGQDRVVYGRPRRFSAIDTYAKEGLIPVVCDFATVDDVAYGPTDSSVALTIAGPLGGGLTAPLTAPLITTAGSDRSIVATVGGELPAWPVITIHGPIVNPTVEVVNRWQITLLTTLAYDQSVTIDTRPWRRTVLRNNGGSLAGALTRASARLSQASISPGSYEIALSGTDETGTASLLFAWRETYTI